MRRSMILATAVVALSATGARAGEALRDLCPDRPGKGTSACTVDKGHWQLEVDALDATRDRSDGQTTDTWLVAAPLLKYGVTDRVDLEVGLTPYLKVRTKDRSTGATNSDSGLGDTFIKGKALAYSSDTLSVAAELSVKLPTAKKTLGDGKVEEALIVPVAITLPAGWALGLTGEGDWLENGAGDGRHGAGSLTLGLSRNVGPVNLGAELWRGWDFDPDGTSRQASFDLSAAWIPKRQKNLQLDGGVNFGLNHATPQAQLYAGVSRRF